MKLVAFYKDGVTRVGVKQEEGIRLIEGTLNDVFYNGLEGLIEWEPSGLMLNEETLEFAPCIPPIEKSFALG